MATVTFTNDIGSFTGGNFSGFATPGSGAISYLNGTYQTNWSFSPSPQFSGVGILNPSGAGWTAAPSGNPYVGCFNSNSANTTPYLMTVTLSGLSTTTAYALRFNLGLNSLYGIPSSFTVTVTSNSVTQTIWALAPNKSSWTTINTTPFTPGASTVTVTITSVSYSNRTSYVTIDNLQIVRGSALQSATDLLSPFVSSVYSIPGGKFDIFGTVGSPATLPNYGIFYGPGALWSNPGVAPATGSGGWIVPPSGSSYVGYINAHPSNANGYNYMQFTLGGFSTSGVYAVAMNIARNSSYATPSAFTITSTWASTTTTIYNTVPTNSTYAAIQTSRFTPAQSTVTFTITAAASAAQSYTMFDNLCILKLWGGSTDASGVTTYTTSLPLTGVGSYVLTASAGSKLLDSSNNTYSIMNGSAPLSFTQNVTVNGNTQDMTLGSPSLRQNNLVAKLGNFGNSTFNGIYTPCGYYSLYNYDGSGNNKTVSVDGQGVPLTMTSSSVPFRNPVLYKYINSSTVQATNATLVLSNNSKTVSWSQSSFSDYILLQPPTSGTLNAGFSGLVTVTTPVTYSYDTSNNRYVHTVSALIGSSAFSSVFAIASNGDIAVDGSGNQFTLVVGATSFSGSINVYGTTKTVGISLPSPRNNLFAISLVNEPSALSSSVLSSSYGTPFAFFSIYSYDTSGNFRTTTADGSPVQISISGTPAPRFPTVLQYSAGQYTSLIQAASSGNTFSWMQSSFTSQSFAVVNITPSGTVTSGRVPVTTSVTYVYDASSQKTTFTTPVLAGSPTFSSVFANALSGDVVLDGSGIQYNVAPGSLGTSATFQQTANVYGTSDRYTVTLPDVRNNNMVVRLKDQATALSSSDYSASDTPLTLLSVYNYDSSGVPQNSSVDGTGVLVNVTRSNSTYPPYLTLYKSILPYTVSSSGSPTIQTIGSNSVYVFTGAGSITPSTDIQVSYLVVAGGGGGGANGGGGGGAGGLLTGTAVLLAGTTYSVTVGTGGAAGNTTSYVSGSNGTNSVLSGTGITTITAIGGGGGTTASAGSRGTTGGSGGGGDWYQNLTGANGTTGQGYAGGNGAYGGNGGGGGGGGAGSAGSNAPSAGYYTGGAGGSGYYFAATQKYYAGGGGGSSQYGGSGPPGSGVGGAGGSGIGGSGNVSGAGGSGTANTGSGGGAGNGGNGGTGAAGVVILVFPPPGYLATSTNVTVSSDQKTASWSQSTFTDTLVARSSSGTLGSGYSSGRFPTTSALTYTTDASTNIYKYTISAQPGTTAFGSALAVANKGDTVTDSSATIYSVAVGGFGSPATPQSFTSSTNVYGTTQNLTLGFPDVRQNSIFATLKSQPTAFSGSVYSGSQTPVGIMSLYNYDASGNNKTTTVDGSGIQLSLTTPSTFKLPSLYYCWPTFSSPSATSGSPVTTTVGSYTVYTFTGSTGSITFPSDTTVTYLVVAGGGGGGNNGGGGGGGGGLLTGTVKLTGGVSYSITVGAGGAGSGNYGVLKPGYSGGNSTLSGTGITTITAIGGGGGSSRDAGAQPATSGGSGGGGSSQSTTAGASGTQGQGYAGGTGMEGGYMPGGGGGGAGGAGGNASNYTTAGTGGPGYLFPITNAYYAAGGGGASASSNGTPANGGSGIGGNGNKAGVGGTGTANTGSGGGGGANNGTVANSSGGAGGSGIVILAVHVGGYAQQSTPLTLSNNNKTVSWWQSSFSDYMITHFGTSGTLNTGYSAGLVPVTTPVTYAYDTSANLTRFSTSALVGSRAFGSVFALAANGDVATDGSGNKYTLVVKNSTSVSTTANIYGVNTPVTLTFPSPSNNLFAVSIDNQATALSSTVYSGAGTPVAFFSVYDYDMSGNFLSSSVDGSSVLVSLTLPSSVKFPTLWQYTTPTPKLQVADLSVNNSTMSSYQVGTPVLSKLTPTFTGVSTPQYSIGFTTAGNYYNLSSSVPQIAAASVSQDMWIEGWIYCPSAPAKPTSSSSGCLIGKMNPVAGNVDWMFGIDNNLKMNFYIWTGSMYWILGGTITTSTWYHVAVGFTKSTGAMQMFLNGSLCTLTNGSGTSLTGFGTTTVMTTGLNNYGGNLAVGQFNGVTCNTYVSNLRVVYGTGAVQYTSNFTVPTSPLETTTSRTTVLLLTPSYVTPTATGILDYSPNSLALSSYTSGTVATNTSSPFPNCPEGAADFTNGYISFANNVIPGINSAQDMWIEMWVYCPSFPNRYTNVPTMFGCMNPTTTTNYWSLGIDASLNFAFYFVGGDYVGRTLRGGTVTIQTWNHIALAYQQSTGYIWMFLNGVPSLITLGVGAAGSLTGFGSTKVASTYTGLQCYKNYTAMTIGQYNNIKCGAYISNLRLIVGAGAIQYTRGFPVPTTPLNVSASGTTALLMKVPAAAIYSPVTAPTPNPLDTDANLMYYLNFNAGSISGNTVSGPVGSATLNSANNAALATIDTGNYVTGTGSLAFNSGNQNYVQFPAATLARNGFTFSVWFFVGSGSMSNSQRIIEWTDNATHNIMFTYGYTNGLWQGSFWNIDTQNTIVGLGTFQPNAWNHVVWAVSNGNWSIFINGTKYTVTPNTAYPSNVPLTYCYLGRSGGGSDPYITGNMDDFRYYTRTLTDSEAMSLFKYSPYSAVSSPLLVTPTNNTLSWSQTSFSPQKLMMVSNASGTLDSTSTTTRFPITTNITYTTDASTNTTTFVAPALPGTASFGAVMAVASVGDKVIDASGKQFNVVLGGFGSQATAQTVQKTVNMLGSTKDVTVSLPNVRQNNIAMALNSVPTLTSAEFPPISSKTPQFQMSIYNYDNSGNSLTTTSDGSGILMSVDLGSAVQNPTLYKYDSSSNIWNATSTTLTISGTTVSWYQSTFSDYMVASDTYITPETVEFAQNTIFLATPSIIGQNLDIYTSSETFLGYEYNFIVDLYSSGVANSLNDLFSTRNYIQSDTNADLYNVSLIVNQDMLYNWTQTSNAISYTAYSGLATYGMSSDRVNLGQRLLEVVAIKIFGHGQARAAIENDSDFYKSSLANSLAGTMDWALGADSNLIFNQYVTEYRTIVSDVGNNALFNFYNVDMMFPVVLQGSLVGSSGSSVLSNSLLNGPLVGGNQLVNGQYRVPLYITFKTTPPGYNM